MNDLKSRVIQYLDFVVFEEGRRQVTSIEIIEYLKENGGVRNGLDLYKIFKELGFSKPDIDLEDYFQERVCVREISNTILKQIRDLRESLVMWHETSDILQAIKQDLRELKTILD